MFAPHRLCGRLPVPTGRDRPCWQRLPRLQARSVAKISDNDPILSNPPCLRSPRSSHAHAHARTRRRCKPTALLHEQTSSRHTRTQAAARRRVGAMPSDPHDALHGRTPEPEPPVADSARSSSQATRTNPRGRTTAPSSSHPSRRSRESSRTSSPWRARTRQNLPPSLRSGSSPGVAPGPPSG